MTHDTKNCANGPIKVLTVNLQRTTTDLLMEKNEDKPKHIVWYGPEDL
jgi:hypothetical protein